MAENKNEGFEPGTYVKDGVTRVVETVRDAVKAKFDGFKLVEQEAPVEDKSEANPESVTEAPVVVEGEQPSEPARPRAPRGR